MHIFSLPDNPGEEKIKFEKMTNSVTCFARVPKTAEYRFRETSERKTDTRLRKERAEIYPHAKNH